MHQFELTREYIDNLRDVIERKDEAVALQLMEELHAADIAEIYKELNIDEARYLYLLLDKEVASDVLVELEEDERERFLKVLPSEVIAKQFIEVMDSDDAADVIGEMSEDKKQEVLSHIDDIEQAGDIADLLNYDENSAGGLMAKELIAVNENYNVNDCIAEIRKQGEDVDEIYNIYVIDDDGKLTGILPLKKLLISPSNSTISGITDTEVKYARTETPAEDVANAMNKYDLVAMPVVDDAGRLVGRITFDDVVDVIREEAEKDYQMASGISEDVEPTDKVWVLTRARIPWLLIGLVGGVFAALVMGYYEGDIKKYAGLAAFIPLIAAMAGNVGVQSSAIIVQALANRSLGIESSLKKLLKEFTIALIIGIIFAAIMFLYNYYTSDSFALTITVSIALFSVILFASLFGTFVPLALERLKIDPALATGPFITTINDITGLFIYLFIGRIIFGAI